MCLCVCLSVSVWLYVSLKHEDNVKIEVNKRIKKLITITKPAKQCVIREEGTGGASALRTISWGFPGSPRLKLAERKTSRQSHEMALP